MDYISYLPTLRGDHLIFVVTIQKCKCSIFQLVLLRFYRSHQYLYLLLIFYFFEIRDLEQYWEIVGNGPTPVQKVRALYSNITIIVRFISPIFIVITYYCVFVLESDSSTKMHSNIVESLFCIPGTSAEHKDYSRVKLIVESKIGLLL